MKLIEVIKKQSALSLIKGMIKKFIKSQKTAYDVDKVMQQLEKERNIQYRKDGSMLSARSNISIDKAIEIVKAGGTNE